MQVRIMVLDGGKVEVDIDDATEEQAVQATQQVLALLQAKGLPIQATSDIEFHRNGGSHAHVNQRLDAGHHHH